MVEVIEKGWLELQRLGMSHEMDTTSMVTTIEKLLPRTQKREWVTKMDQRENHDAYNNGSIFRMLLAFLLQEKRVIEYMENDIHTNTRSFELKTIASSTQC